MYFQSNKCRYFGIFFLSLFYICIYCNWHWIPCFIKQKHWAEKGHTHWLWGSCCSGDIAPLFQLMHCGQDQTKTFHRGAVCVCVCVCCTQKGLKSWKKCWSLRSYSKQEAVPTRDRDAERDRERLIMVSNL